MPEKPGKYWDRSIKCFQGCTPVSPGCYRCFSATEDNMRQYQKNIIISGRAKGLTLKREDNSICYNGKVRFDEKLLENALKTKKPQIFFIWNDPFHNGFPDKNRNTAFNMMFDYKHHTYLILTKRARAMAEFFNGISGAGANYHWPGNFWFGITVCNQEELDRDIKYLLEINGKRWLSIEPMLDSIDLTRWLICPNCESDSTCEFDRDIGLPINCFDNYSLKNNIIESPIKQVICGTETGFGSRKLDLKYIRIIRQDCITARVPFYLKWLGKEHGRTLDGREHNDLAWRV
jgi:protein gp37